MWKTNHIALIVDKAIMEALPFTNTTPAITGGTIVAAVLSGCTILASTLSGNTILNSTSSGGTHVGGTFSGNTIIGPTISGGTYVNGTLSGITFIGGSISGSTITSAGGALSGTTLNAPVGSGGTWVAGTFSGTTLIGPIVSGGTWVGGTTSGTTHIGAAISGSTFIGGTLSGSTLISVTLSGSTFVGGTLSSPSVTGTIAGAASWSGLQTFTGVSFGNETLSQYDEGTWTPVLTASTTPGSHTYNEQVGRYTRIGRMVTVTWNMSVNSKDAALSGNVRVGGFPFTVNANADVAGSLANLINITFGDGIGIRALANGTSGGLIKQVSGGTATDVTEADVGSSPRIYGSITYEI